METITKVLALSLTILFLCGLLTACGKEEDEETFSKSLHRPPDKVDFSLPAGINEYSVEEIAGLSLQIQGTVAAGAKSVSFHLYNADDTDFSFGYADLLLQKKTESGWETYRRIDAVPEIGIVAPAGGSSGETIRPEQYGVELNSGETYRIALAGAPDVYGEFTVK